MKSLARFVLSAIAVLLIATEATAQKVVVVSATQPWTSAGIRAITGQQLLVFARGLYSNGYNNRSALSWSDPAGRGIPGTGTWQDPNSPIMALIGKIGTSGTPFYVGPYSIISPSSTDSLYLGVNDDGSFNDNYGYAIAFIYTSWLPTSIAQPSGQSIQPNQFHLEQNFPNPFNPSTTIEYQLPTRSNVTISIYNSVGQLVRVLHPGELAPGTYRTVWDSKDEAGNSVASGAYFYQVKVGDAVQTKKAVFIK